MRYTVKYWDGKNIINDLSTNDFSEVIKRQHELKKQYDDVWYADILLEILVG
jgi:hypothetical protein